MSTGTNPGTRRTVDQINADYRATVAQRKIREERREAAMHAFWLGLTKICATINFFFCAFMIVMSIKYMIQAIQTQHTPTPIGEFVIGLLIVQACGWTYMVSFPRYIASLQ